VGAAHLSSIWKDNLYRDTHIHAVQYMPSNNVQLHCVSKKVPILTLIRIHHLGTFFEIQCSDCKQLRRNMHIANPFTRWHHKYRSAAKCWVY